MTTSKRHWLATRDDEGVSPVIAVILMVAITVVLAATVYVWVSGFATEDTGPEQAAATAKGIDLDSDGDVEWMQVTLTSGQNAPYSGDDVTFSVTNNTGGSVANICQTAQLDGAGDCSTDFDLSDSSTDEWDVGENLWVPCEGDGNHVLTVSVSGTAILDAGVSCDAIAS